MAGIIHYCTQNVNRVGCAANKKLSPGREPEVAAEKIF